MTIDECIKHCEEVAEEKESICNVIENEGETWTDSGKTYYDICKKRASEHRQLAKWLRELKKYRIAHWKLGDMDYEYDFNSMFGDNPMFYGEKVWDLFGDIDASV